jgi:hypothetical protein
MMVPGSAFPGLDHPFSWYAIVREKKTGKEWTYWMNGTLVTRETVANEIATKYRNVEVVTIDRCTSSPTRPLQPVPASHYEFGYREDAERIDDPSPSIAKPIPIRPISIRPISIQPLSLRR